MKQLPILTIRDFRASFQNLTGPVQVIRARASAKGKVEIIGTWTPEKKK